MDTEKACRTCKHGKAAYPNKICDDCMPNNLKNWTPKEEFVKEYVERCIPGESSATINVTHATYDVVSKPKHYMLFEDKGIEVRDVIEKLVLKAYAAYANNKGTIPNSLQAPMFESDYVQLMQYLMRFMDKNGVEDLKKARWYLDKLIQSY